MVADRFAATIFRLKEAFGKARQSAAVGGRLMRKTRESAAQ
jgi:hypothetical protein